MEVVVVVVAVSKFKSAQTIPRVFTISPTRNYLAKQGRVIRRASIEAQSKQKEQAEAQTGKGDSDSDSEHWSNPECEGDKPDEDDVLTEDDKTKAKLNKNLPKGVKTVGLSKHGPIREVSYETIDGHKIIHYSRSLVTKNDLNTGKDVTARFREIIEEIGIKSIKGNFKAYYALVNQLELIM